MRRKSIQMGALLMVLLFVFGVTLVFAEGDPETYYACVNSESGAVKIVGSDDTCRNKEYKIEWNNVGPAGQMGPAGPEGLQGPIGPIGPEGPQGLIGPQGPEGTQGLVGPATATLAFNPVPTYGDITLTNITINGGGVTAPVVPGASLQVELDYSIVQPGWCPGCIQQIVVGFAGNLHPEVCLFNGHTGSGHASFTLTAPLTPGTHYLAFNRPMMYTCGDALIWDWPIAMPAQYIGVIAVH